MPGTDVFTRTYVSFWKVRLVAPMLTQVLHAKISDIFAQQTEAEKTKELVYVLWILPKDG